MSIPQKSIGQIIVLDVPRLPTVPEEKSMRSASAMVVMSNIAETPATVRTKTEKLLRLKEGDRVLEIGTGSGYQAAVLATIVEHVYSVEIVEEPLCVDRNTFAEKVQVSRCEQEFNRSGSCQQKNYNSPCDRDAAAKGDYRLMEPIGSRPCHEVAL